MSKQAKEAVTKFYSADNQHKREVLERLLHPECELYWNSSKGFLKLNKKEILELVQHLENDFHSIRAEISHLISKGDQVSIRFTYHVQTIENPEEEVPLAHFIAIWELRDGLMYKGYEMSQLADEDPINIKSFSSSQIRKL